MAKQNQGDGMKTVKDLKLRAEDAGAKGGAVTSQTEKRLEQQRKDLVRSWAG